MNHHKRLSNVRATGLAKAKGVKITFAEFAKTGLAIVALTTFVSNVIIILMFWVI